ncbi:recombinase family protein [Haloferula sp. BvORR071]|uniref:recombinase family protein n=1 Tax=Haloferula sp. BvORR071 TaxID=1396141 RepID=UPI002241048D|nr:recombinase family protein [Haloferula sp. BvORR071]
MSTAEQAADGRAGIARQREVVERVAREKLYDVVEQIELVDVSGTSLHYAPEIMGLIERIERKEIDIVLCSEMSRLGRPEELNSFALLGACQRNGVLLDLGGTIHDLASPEGFLSGGILALLGGHERMQMLKRMMQSKEAKRARGQNPQSHITLPLGIGYDRKAERYTFTPDIVKVIEAYRLIDEEGLRNLSEIGRRAGNLSAATTKNALKNPVYRGVRIYDKFRDQSKKTVKKGGRQGDRPKIKRPADRVIEVRIFSPEDQCVSDERWNRVQELLRGIRENHEVAVAERHEGNLLSGTARCGYCGTQRIYCKRRNRKLSEKSSTKGHYICRTHHETQTKKAGNVKCRQGWSPMEEMDELLEAFVCRFLADTSFVEAVIANARTKQAGKIVSLDFSESINDKLADLEKRDRRIVDALVDGAISTAEAKERRMKIEQEKAFLVRSVGSSSEQSSDQDELSDIARQIAEGVKGWPAQGTTKEKKAFLQRIFSEIYFRGPEITAFRIAPGLLGPNLGNWSFIADIPVSLDPPVRLKEPEPEVVVPEGHFHCKACKTNKPKEGFYPGNNSTCRRCRNQANTKLKRRNRSVKSDGGE